MSWGKSFQHISGQAKLDANGHTRVEKLNGAGEGTANRASDISLMKWFSNYGDREITSTLVSGVVVDSGIKWCISLGFLFEAQEVSCTTGTQYCLSLSQETFSVLACSVCRFGW